MRGGGTPASAGLVGEDGEGVRRGIRPGLRTGGRGAARVCRLELSPARRERSAWGGRGDEFGG